MDLFSKAYEYIAGGQTVCLEPDGKFAGIKLDGLDDKERRLVEEGARIVSPGMAVVKRDVLSEAQLGTLHKQGALFPVFTGKGASMIALPEVRVEPQVGMAGMKSLTKWLHAHADQIKVTSQAAHRIVLEPVSGYGPDAVTIAHNLATKFKGLSASPRFVRIVSRPK